MSYTSLLTTLLFEEMLLTEANVVNIKDPIGSTITITSYLKDFMNNLATDPVKSAFQKKITLFLVNDERFLYALRKIPDNAPDWVKRAQGNLVYFVPNEDLTNTLREITHYLAAAEQDAQDESDKNKQVHAQRELQGLPKAENLDLLARKATEYFARGSKTQQTRDVDGMEHVFDASKGFTWWELKSTSAFQREGKVLQNCIGKFYTAESCKKTGMRIYVMRNSNNESVVACSVVNNKLSELKGKQNKPPVGKYAEPAIEFLNEMEFDITDSAMHELVRAGYYYHQADGQFYTLGMAVKKFAQRKEVGTVGNAYKVMETSVESSTLRNHLFPRANRYEYRNKKVVIYQVARDDTIIQTLYVGDKELYDIDATITIPQEIQNQVFALLFNKKAVTSLTDEIHQGLFWRQGVRWSEQDKKIVKVAADKEHKYGKHTWDEFSSADLLRQLHQGLAPRYGELPVARKDIKKAFIFRESANRTLIFVVNKKNEVVPAMINRGNVQSQSWFQEPSRDAEFSRNARDPQEWSAIGFDPDEDEYGQVVDNMLRSDEVIESLIEFANDQKLKLPSVIRIKHGIIRGENGKFETYKPKSTVVNNDPQTILFDFERTTDPNFWEKEYEVENRAIIAGMLSDIGELGTGNDPITSGSSKYGRMAFHRSYKRGAYDRHQWMDINDLEDLDPTGVYVVDVKYGADRPHKVAMIASNKTIKQVDTDTLEQSWQSWGDVDKVAAQLNKAADDLGLTFDKNAVAYAPELRVVRGRLTSEAAKLATSLERQQAKKPNTLNKIDEIPFENGIKLKKMDALDQIEWMRTKIRSSMRGEVWYAELPNGNILAAYFISNGKVKKLFFEKAAKTSKQLPTTSGYTLKSLRIIKAAADKMNWTCDLPFVKLDDSTTGASSLIDLATLEEEGKYKAVGNLSDYPGVQKLLRVGFAKRAEPDEDEEEEWYTHYLYVELTDAGRRAAAAVKANGSANAFDFIPGIAVDSSFSIPEPEPEPAPATRTAAERPARAALRGAGPSKLDMAVDRFRAFQEEHGRIPTAAEFKPILTAEPFNMSTTGAQTYYYNTRNRVAQQLGEHCHLTIAYATEDEYTMNLLTVLIVEAKRQKAADREAARGTITKEKPNLGLGSAFNKLNLDQPTSSGELTASKSSGAPAMHQRTASKEKTRQAAAGARLSQQQQDQMSNMSFDQTELDMDNEISDAEAAQNAGVSYGYEDVEPRTPENLPAIISTAMTTSGTAAATRSPVEINWHMVKNLPGYLAAPIRAMGRAVFGPFTSTPIEKIQVLADVGGGPNSKQEIDAMASYLIKNGDRDREAEITFQRVIEGYEASVVVYNAEGYTFFVVKDFAGSYIYSWPQETSKDLEFDRPPLPPSRQLR